MPCPGLGYDELSRSFNGHLLERKKCKGGLKSSLHWVEHEKQSKDIIAPAELEVFRTSRQENTSMILFYLVFLHQSCRCWNFFFPTDNHPLRNGSSRHALPSWFSRRWLSSPELVPVGSMLRPSTAPPGQKLNFFSHLAFDNSRKRI
jgi:hypothetical protein